MITISLFIILAMVVLLLGVTSPVWIGVAAFVAVDIMVIVKIVKKIIRKD